MNGRKSSEAEAAAAGRRRPAQQGKDGQRRPMFRRRKVCKFCSDKIDDINYKDVRMLMPFVPERAKVLPRRISGTCALHQRKLRTAIMRARQLALIPYTDGVGDEPWKSFSENTSTTWAGAARSSRSPRATPGTTCCRASWRCWRPRATRSTSSASGRSWRCARPRRRGRRRPWPRGSRSSRSRSRAASARPSSCTARSPPSTSPTT